MDVRLPLSRAAAFSAYRDRMPQILEFLPNVRAIDLRTRQAQGDIVLTSRDWHGGGEVPAAVRGVITQSMLAWTEIARWDGGSFLCDWKAKPLSFPDGIQCHGRSSFVDEGVGTLLELRGTLHVDGRRLPGVPAFLGGSVARQVEDFLAARIRTNLLETARWFEKYGAEAPAKS
jgi:hypothetical protein